MLEEKDLKKIRRIVIFFYHDERKHWEELERPEKHIYHDLEYFNKKLDLKLGEDWDEDFQELKD